MSVLFCLWGVWWALAAVCGPGRGRCWACMQRRLSRRPHAQRSSRRASVSSRVHTHPVRFAAIVYCLPPLRVAACCGGGEHCLPPLRVAACCGGGEHCLPPLRVAACCGGGEHMQLAHTTTPFAAASSVVRHCVLLLLLRCALRQCAARCVVLCACGCSVPRHRLRATRSTLHVSQLRRSLCDAAVRHAGMRYCGLLLVCTCCCATVSRACTRAATSPSSSVRCGACTLSCLCVRTVPTAVMAAFVCCVVLRVDSTAAPLTPGRATSCAQGVCTHACGLAMLSPRVPPRTITIPQRSLVALPCMRLRAARSLGRLQSDVPRAGARPVRPRTAKCFFFLCVGCCAWVGLPKCCLHQLGQRKRVLVCMRARL
jgi:hypothetical protein